MRTDANAGQSLRTSMRTLMTEWGACVDLTTRNVKDDLGTRIIPRSSMIGDKRASGQEKIVLPANSS